jgi:hypothetical protein
VLAHIMYVSITSCTARTPGVSRVGHVEINKTTAAGEVASHSDGLVAAHRSNGNGVVLLLVDLQDVRLVIVNLLLRSNAAKTHHNVVCATNWKLIPMTSKISLCEVRRAGWVQFKQLFHVKDLNSVVDGFGTDDSIVTEDSDLSPVGTNGVVLRKTAEVDHLALRADLCERSAVVLTDRDEFTTTIGGPTPAGRSTSIVAAEIGVGKEVIKVDVAAPEGVVAVSRDGSSESVLAWREAKFGVLRTIHLTSRKLSFPLCLEDQLVEFCIEFGDMFLPSSVP